MSKNDFLEMNEQSLENLRFIHLEKKASYGGKDVDTEQKSGIIFPNDVIGFYSFGFFDSVKCIRPADSSCMFNYKHHFAVSYPYKRNKNIKKVEQWFGIIPLTLKYQWGNINKLVSNDIFFCDDDLSVQETLPFVGVILISLNCYFQSGQETKGNDFVEFNAFLQKYADLINESIDKNTFQYNFEFCNYMARLYLTLNCSDLCMVVRTDDIKNIHLMNSLIQTVAVNENYQINTTVMFMAQVTGIKDFSKVYKYGENRSDIKFIVRSNKEYSGDSFSYGVNGNGKYVTNLSYDQYMELFFERCKYCVNELLEVEDSKTNQNLDIIKYAESICHERQWFDNEACGICSTKNESVMEQLELKIQKNNDVALKFYNKIREKINDIKIIAKNHLLYYYSTFADHMRIVQELIDTYSDLWYQPSPDGYAFYIQFYIALKGIEGILQDINPHGKNKNQMVNQCKTIVNILQSIIDDINGYNKQMQFLNQDSVNYPSYEIHSKVNAEKYIMAYCSFLHLIFAKYYHEHKNNEGSDRKDTLNRSFPIVFLDINSPDIETTFFFSHRSELCSLDKKKDDEKIALVAVHFPNYSYFADVWTVVPLLTHEVTHGHCYEERKHRNEAIIEFLKKVISQVLSHKMLAISNDGFAFNGVSLLENLLENAFNKSIDDIWKKALCSEEDSVKIADLEIDQLLKIIKVFYANIFAGKDNSVDNISFSSVIQIQDKAKSTLKYILSLFDFKLLPEYLSGNLISQDEIIFKCWLSSLSCIINYNNDKKDNKVDIIIKNIKCYLDGISEKSLSEFYLELYEISKRFIEMYETNDLGNNELEKYRDANYICAQKILFIGSGILAEKYAQCIADQIDVNDCVRQSIKKTIYDMLFEPLAYNIITPMDLYYEKCNQVFDSLYNVYLCESLQIDVNKSKQIKHLIVQCISEYINLSDSAYYIKKYIDNLIDSNGFYTFLEDDIGEFAKAFYKEGHKAIESIKANITDDVFDSACIFEKTSRANLMALGLLSDSSDITKNLLIRMSNCFNENDLSNFIDAKVGIYKEIYADCGMCSAMGFTAFGYMMFCSNIYNMSQTSDLELDEVNSLIERIKEISHIYFCEDNPQSDFERRNFKEKFFNFEMIEDIIQFLNKTYGINDEIQEIIIRAKNDVKEFKNKRLNDKTDIFQYSFRFHIKYWKCHVLDALLIILRKTSRNLFDFKLNNNIKTDRDKYRCKQISIYACSYLENMVYLAECLYDGNILYCSCQDSLFDSYFVGLKGLIDESDWSKCINAQEITDVIRKYYNNNVKKGAKTLLEASFDNYSCGLITHYDFIYKFYSLYRSAYGYIINNSSNDDTIYDWFNLLDSYYKNKSI